MEKKGKWCPALAVVLPAGLGEVIPLFLLKTGEAIPGGLGPVLGRKKDVDTLETVQQKTTEMMRRLERLMNKDMMRELELFSLEERRFTGESH